MNLSALLPPPPYGISPLHAAQIIAELASIDAQAHRAAWEAAGSPGLLALRAASLSTGAGQSSKPYPMDGSVAVISIQGAMSKDGAPSLGIDGTAATRRLVRQATTDPEVRQAFIDVDSPGGEVRGNSALAADIARLASAKPTFAYMEDLGASCAYWAVAGVNAIFAGPGALVGCLGIRMSLVDSTDAASQAGLKFDHVVTGPYKAAGADGSPLTEEHRAYFQGLVDDAGRQFFGAVQRGRGLTPEQMAAVTDGRLFPARQARTLGLIDGVTSRENALAKLKTLNP